MCLRQTLYAILCVVLVASCAQEQDVEVGQVWVKEYYINNPYKPIIRDTVVIIDVIGDYAQYTLNGELDSDSKYWIRINSKLIEYSATNNNLKHKKT